MSYLWVRNVAQQTIFELELKGQLSDGNWENTRPHDHWIAWNHAEVVVNPRRVGRDFAVLKDSYAFTDKALLDVIGLRMQRHVRLALAYGFETARALEFLSDLEGDPRDQDPGWWTPTQKAFAATLNLAEIKRVANDVTLYSWEQLLQDLRDLKKIIKIELPRDYR